MDLEHQALRQKFRLAMSHVVRILDMERQWAASAPYRLSSTTTLRPDEPRIYDAVWKIDLVNEAPIASIGVTAGEALYQLRSILETLAVALARENSNPNGVPPRTGFPIFRREKDYDKPAPYGGEHAIRGISAEAQQIIRDAQPFRSPTPDTHPLWLLHELSNRDRHAPPHLAATFARTHNAQIKTNPYVKVLKQRTLKGPFGDGNDVVVAKLQRLPNGQPHSGLGLHIESGLKFDPKPPEATKAYAGLPVVPVLANVLTFVGTGVLRPLGPLAYPTEPEYWDLTDEKSPFDNAY